MTTTHATLKIMAYYAIGLVRPKSPFLFSLNMFSSTFLLTSAYLLRCLTHESLSGQNRWVPKLGSCFHSRLTLQIKRSLDQTHEQERFSSYLFFTFFYLRLLEQLLAYSRDIYLALSNVTIKLSWLVKIVNYRKVGIRFNNRRILGGEIMWESRILRPMKPRSEFYFRWKQRSICLTF